MVASSSIQMEHPHIVINYIRLHGGRDKQQFSSLE